MLVASLRRVREPRDARRGASLWLFQRLRVSRLGVLVRQLAMVLGGRGVVLGLIVLAARVVMLSLMVMMRGRMVVAGCGVMMLLRRVFCHLSAPLRPIAPDPKLMGSIIP